MDSVDPTVFAGMTDKLLYARLQCSPIGNASSEAYEITPTSYGNLRNGATYATTRFSGTLYFQFEGGLPMHYTLEANAVWADKDLRAAPFYNIMPLGAITHHGYTRLDVKEHSGVVGLIVKGELHEGAMEGPVLGDKHTLYSSGWAINPDPTDDEKEHALDGTCVEGHGIVFEEVQHKIACLPFKNEDFVKLFCKYAEALHVLEPMKQPYGFFKEFAKPKSWRVFNAEIVLDRARKHTAWCEHQKRIHDGYRNAKSLHSQVKEIERFSMNPDGTAGETTKHPVWTDPDYEYEAWERDSCEEADRIALDARSAEYRAERHLTQAKEMIESQIKWASDDKKRRRDDDERWAKRRKNRDTREDTHKRLREQAEERGEAVPTETAALEKDIADHTKELEKFETGEREPFCGGDEDQEYCEARVKACASELTLIKKRKTVPLVIIAGEHEHEICKYITVDPEDETSRLIKITEGYKKGTLLSIPTNDMDWQDDVIADNEAEEKAFADRCKKVLEHFKATVGDVGHGVVSNPKYCEWAFAHNNLEHRFNSTQWKWYFRNADAEWADKPSHDQMITLVKAYCKKEYWNFEYVHDRKP